MPRTPLMGRIRILDRAGRIRHKKKCPACEVSLIVPEAPYCRPCLFAKKRADAITASVLQVFDGIPCRSIPLTKGYVTWVDEARFDELSRWKWQADVHRNGKVYAYRRLAGEERSLYGRANIRMHRQIKGDPAGMLVDHRDGDGLHNWDANLRVATITQNNQNRRVQPGASGLTGVCLDKRRGKYYARVDSGGEAIHLGTFCTREEASEAYKKKAIELHGEFSSVKS